MAPRRHGIARIVTNNDSRNPMVQLNLALGFVPQPAWVRVEKTPDGMDGAKPAT